LVIKTLDPNPELDPDPDLDPDPQHRYIRVHRFRQTSGQECNIYRIPTKLKCVLSVFAVMVFWIFCCLVEKSCFRLLENKFPKNTTKLYEDAPDRQLRAWKHHQKAACDPENTFRKPLMACISANFFLQPLWCGHKRTLTNNGRENHNKFRCKYFQNLKVILINH